jgi:hypothetical protein
VSDLSAPLTSSPYDASGEVERRYPLLAELVIGSCPGTQWNRLPRFLGLLLAAAESSAPEICLVLLPEIEAVGYLTAMLLALSRLQAEFPSLLHEYARRGLQVGQRVRVLPHGYVYGYAGVLGGYNESFKLDVLDANDKAWKTFPVAEILRLEPTERARPRGKGNTMLGSFELSNLDRLVGIQTGGNTSLFRNHVLYLSARAEAQDLAAAVAFARSGRDPVHGVGGAGIPWGLISPDGAVQRDDDYQRSGEPLIAVTHSPDHLAAACEQAAPLSKLVIANDAEKLARNLQAYDRIAQTQRLLIIASHRSAEAAEQLGERGCRVWRLSPAEIRHGEPVAERGTSGGAVGRLFQAVENWQALTLASVDCEDAILDEVAGKLESVGHNLDPAATRDETKRVVGRLFALLCEAGEVCGEAGEETAREAKGRLDILERTIEQEGVWLPREVRAALKDACKGLRLAYDADATARTPGLGKAPVLQRLIEDLNNRGLERILVVTRTPAGARSVGGLLTRNNYVAIVRAISEAEQFAEADAVILTAWPNTRRLSDLIGRYLASQFYLVAFRFERHWFSGFRRHHVATMRRGEIEPSMKAAITGLPIGAFSPVERNAPGSADAGSEVPSVVKIEDLLLRQRKGAALAATGRDENRPARYAGFVGAGYAYLSEWQHLPVITSLVRGTAGSRPRLDLRTVDALTVGDYVVFRGGAESNIVRSVAEQLTGAEEYARLRERAEAWRQSLRRLGNDPRLRLADLSKVHALLRRWGLSIGLHTVRRWLYDETQIGPGDDEALVAIAKAVADEDLLAKRADVWDAIRAVRTLHLEAGRRLSQLLLDNIQRNPPQVGSRETRIEVAGAPAWILEVEELGGGYEPRSSGQVNRLLWDDTFV